MLLISEDSIEEHGIIKRDVMLASIPSTVSESDITGVTCFCPICQCHTMETTTFCLSNFDKMHDFTLLNKFVPFMPLENSPIAQEWEKFQHIVKAAMDAQKGFRMFMHLVEAEQEQESQS